MVGIRPPQVPPSLQRPRVPLSGQVSLDLSTRFASTSTFGHLRPPFPLWGRREGTDGGQRTVTKGDRFGLDFGRLAPRTLRSFCRWTLCPVSSPSCSFPGLSSVGCFLCHPAPPSDFGVSCDRPLRCAWNRREGVTTHYRRPRGSRRPRKHYLRVCEGGVGLSSSRGTVQRTGLWNGWSSN